MSVADEAYFIEPTEGVAQGADAPEPGAVTSAAGPEENAELRAGAGDVLQTTHTQSGPAGAALAPSATDVPPAAAPQTEPSTAQTAGEAPDGGPAQPPPVATPPTDGVQNGTNPTEAMPGNPSAAANASPATTFPTASAVPESGIPAPATTLWPEDLLPPLPSALNPFDS